MNIRDYAKKYYLDQNRNCAESVFLAAGEALGLGVTAEDAKLIAAFGGGMGCGSTCGALAGAMAILGKCLVQGDAHSTDGFKERCAALKAAFEQRLGGIDCDVLKPLRFREEARCLATVELACDVLQEQLGRPLEDAAPLSADEIKRVKGLGFLQQKGTRKFNGRVITRNGLISAAETRALAEAAERFGSGRVAMTTRLTVEVQGIPYENIEPFRAYLAQAGLETGGTGSKVRPVVSCKGTTCQYGLCDTFALSEKLHRLFYVGYHGVTLPHKFKIAVGGCPNNCVKPDLNDLGIIGQMVPNFDSEECNGCKKCGVAQVCPMGAARLDGGELTIDKELCNNCGRCIDKCYFDAMDGGTFAYKIYIGGRWGKRTATGRPLSKLISTKEEALSIIEKAILLFREEGRTGERFADTIERLGFEHVEQELLSDGILARKQAILDAQLHITGGATC